MTWIYHSKSFDLPKLRVGSVMDSLSKITAEYATPDSVKITASHTDEGGARRHDDVTISELRHFSSFQNQSLYLQFVIKTIILLTSEFMDSTTASR